MISSITSNLIPSASAVDPVNALQSPAIVLGRKPLSDLDGDKDGTVSLADFKAAYAAVDSSGQSSDASNAAATALFNRINTNGDGKISSQEWSNYQDSAQQQRGSLARQTARAVIQSMQQQLIQSAFGGSSTGSVDLSGLMQQMKMNEAGPVDTYSTLSQASSNISNDVSSGVTAADSSSGSSDASTPSVDYLV